jgi:predicted small secreted protein
VEYQTDARFALLFFLVLLAALLLGGCNCTAGSDAISATICTTDKPE